MVTEAEIDALYDSTLKPRLAALEGLRGELKGYVTKAALVVGVPAVLLWANGLLALAMPDGLAWIALAGPFVGIFVGLYVAATRYLLPGFAAFSNYRARFKHEVAAEVFKIVRPDAAYSPFEGIAKDVFDEAGLFNTRGRYTSDDRVRGRIGQTPFEAADVSRVYSTGGKNSRTVVVFRGLFFHLDFNKTLRGVTLVDPKARAGTSRGDRSTLSEVPLENPAFTEVFTVYASDDVEARYILTPSMMERILALQARTEKPLHLAFCHNRAFLGVHYGRPLFEPGITASTSITAIHEMAAHFALADGIVEELDLNTRIWTKGVDDSRVHADEASPTVDPLDAAARTGTLTAETLWEVARASTTDGHDLAADATSPRPDHTSITVERNGSTVVVRYGLGLGFALALAIWATGTAVALAGARLLAEEWRMPALRVLTAWIPEIPYASALASMQPLVWTLVSSVAAVVGLLVWALRVRRVEVTPDVIRIWRGLRPLPRRYPRPEYGKVVRVDNAVYVGKSAGLALINASASPMLSDGEAPWVATELRQALRDTAR